MPQYFLFPMFGWFRLMQWLIIRHPPAAFKSATADLRIGHSLLDIDYCSQDSIFVFAERIPVSAEAKFGMTMCAVIVKPFA